MSGETRHEDGVFCVYTEWTSSSLVFRQYLDSGTVHEMLVPRATALVLMAKIDTMLTDPLTTIESAGGFGLHCYEGELMLTPPMVDRRSFVNTLDCPGVQASNTMWHAIAREIERIILGIAPPVQAHESLAQALGAPRR